jgi:ureidoglycolate hydrolase
VPDARMPDVRTLTIKAQPLTVASWEPFGRIPVNDTDPVDPVQIEFLWGDPHVNFISHAYGEVDHTDGGSLCAVMYRHDTHTQTIMPTNCDSVVAVAPAGVDFSRPDHLDTIRAFLVHPLDCFVLARGTWHWGPFPLGPEAVRLFNVQGRRYAEDNASVELPRATGAVVEVIV